MGNQNPGIHVPSHGVCDSQVRQAIQDIVRHLGTTSTPTFSEMTLEDLTLNTPVKIYALDHDSWAGFVADEHVAHSGVSVLAGAGMSGGGTIAASRTLTNADRGSVAVATHEATYDHTLIPAAEEMGQWDDAYSHISSDGTDHTYIDQDVQTTASPTFTGLTIDADPGVLATFQSTGDTVNSSVSFQAERYLTLGLAAYRTSGAYAGLQLKRAQGTIASPMSVADNDEMGSVTFWGHDSSDFVVGASIFSIVDGTPSVGNVPALLHFYTTEEGGSYSCKMELGGSGNLRLLTMTSAGFVKNNASGVLSGGNSLDAGDIPDLSATYQPLDSDLTAISGFDKTDGNFIVGNGSAWVAESGNTARTSLGLGTGNSPTFADLIVTDRFKIDNSSPYLTSIGFEAGKNITGSYNTMVGYQAGKENTTSSSNIGIGMWSCGAQSTSPCTGGSNLCIGTSSGPVITTGNHNVFIGVSSGKANATGEYTVAIGYNAGRIGVAQSGSVLIGASAGRNTNSSNRFIIDNQDRGSAAAESTSSLLYGIFDATPANQTLRCNAKFGVNTNPSEEVHAADTIRADTFFNHNGTDGVSNSDAGVPTALTVSGGIVTAVTKTTGFNGTFINGSGDTVTVSNGLITGVA